jgi:thiamine biosynthesis lipoprotein
MSKKIFLLPGLLFIFILSCRISEKWHTSTFLFFDTICETNLFCTPSLFESSKEKVRLIFQNIEDHFSPDSKIVSSSLVKNLYEKALLVYRQSDGCFDITVAPLSRIWGFRGGSCRIPPPDEIKKALGLIGMDRIILFNETLGLPPGMELDWGGIAKGFGIDLAADALIQMGIQHGFVNAGGDLFCWGKNPEHTAWQIGIKHPRNGGLSAVLSLSGMGAATTGDYQRCFFQGGIRYHHVFDPKTGYPSRGKQSVTVVGPEALFCDALSTALFVSSTPEKILEKFPEYGAFVIDAEGKFIAMGKPYPFRSIN